MKIDKDAYVLKPEPFLSAKSAQIYDSLFPEIKKDNQLLEKLLLRRFYKNSDWFRVDFWSNKLQSKEIYKFRIILKCMSEQRLEPSNADATHSSVVEFKVSADFYHLLPQTFELS